MSKPNPIKNNSPSYHRRVLSDQTIVFNNRQYPVSYDVGSLVLVELLAEKNELHIQPLHVLKPDISASNDRLHNPGRIDHEESIYKHLDSLTNFYKNLSKKL